MLLTVLVVLLLLAAFGSFPGYAYSRNWGYFPSGTLVFIVLILLLLRFL